MFQFRCLLSVVPDTLLFLISLYHMICSMICIYWSRWPRVLSKYFGDMIDIMHSNKGEVIKFAGDALIVGGYTSFFLLCFVSVFFISVGSNDLLLKQYFEMKVNIIG